ncbi:gliding motility-associated C-terminal domain-containing protein [Segetibacter koreensis]|uniref:T9SS type B sorting domain-containing protein n=1 Tax=Segetibacter koreensis TaxID=398037 RepID=UPI00036A34DE|nr:gliding motility-associated C-terminal domain-containing protein [Segetibacter koreensis]
MASTRNFFLFLISFYSSVLHAQTCSNLGQNPGTAFPVCGSSAFSQTTVSTCGDREIPTPCTSTSALFQDKNPYWYKFTCFTAGTLGFLITPNNLDDDYDWQLFDITGHAPEEIYTDKTLFVACNWSGDPGKTGASSQGTSSQLCDGPGVPLFSSMPQLQKGHNYLLLVSHFTDSQSGYSLDFAGGSASITDTTPPRLQAAKPLCDSKRISIKLNKKMKCSSLSANGSDFTISNSSVSVTGAAAASCSTGFDMDSLVVTLSDPLAPGNYTIYTAKGTDGNTLLDNCDAAVPVGDGLAFTILPPQPAAFDSITPPACAPNELSVVFSQPILCNSVAADGSDFILSGPSSAVITGATTTCNNNVTTGIQLKLSTPISKAGTYTVRLKKGKDGNTVMNECSVETPEGASVTFATSDTVSADFTYSLKLGCKADTGIFYHKGGNGINNWSWQIGNAPASTQKSFVHVFSNFGQQEVKLSVSNGTCTDSTQVTFNLDNELKANFTAPGMLCPEDVATFKDTSIGNVIAWDWNFGNGNSSTSKNPPVQAYQLTTSEKDYQVRLIVKNDSNCFDTAYKQVKVLYNCYIAVASAFTPNGDGLNDYLYPINAYKAKNLIFKIYNRFGQVVFQSTDFMTKWDGTFKGIKQQTGTYVWTLKYINTDTGKPFSLKGTTVLIR